MVPSKDTAGETAGIGGVAGTTIATKQVRESKWGTLATAETVSPAPGDKGTINGL